MILLLFQGSQEMIFVVYRRRRIVIIVRLEVDARGTYVLPQQISVGAVENDRKHDDLSMWDPWIYTHGSIMTS